MKQRFKNCFALKSDGKCSCLTQTLCRDTNRCPFYKSKAEFRDKRKKANARLKKIFGSDFEEIK